MGHNYQKLMTLIPDLRGRLAESTLEGHPLTATLSVLMSGHEDRSFSLYAGAFCVGNAYFPLLMSSHGGAFCVGNAHLETSCRVTEERSAWEIPIYKTQVEPWRSILRGKSLFTNSICCLEERFVWEIPICKLNLLLGGAFCVGNSYLQTSTSVGNTYLQIQSAAWRSILCGKFLFANLDWSVSCGKFYISGTGISIGCI